MNKPYIVCHMMTSVDGRIDCAMTEHLPGVQEYYDTLDALDAPTRISGRVTAELEMALPGKFEAKTAEALGKEAFSKAADAEGYEIVVETVCLLSKLNAKQHIEVDIHMDELDLTDAEKKATYSEIKEYVLEHTGLKVSSLYIAQVKQKCGIIERENYNKPKSDDAKQPQCPPDKEKAIKEALKHFGMI